ncbi:uncharacterized protein [Mytilus edulis]|uniref:uncharacterized protein n=1 Tax=Mytilus edulis TaxID=6550 RepID=UPI0039EFCC2B
MASSQQNLCDVCINQHITQNAIIRCPECEENFCEKCKIHHEFAKATRKHEIVSIENVLKLPKFVQEIKMNCSEHDEKLVLYCDDHGIPCCTHCLQNAHAMCRNVIPIQKVIQNVKESSLLVDLQTTLSDLRTNITNIIEDRKANLKDLKEQKTKCKWEIETARESINAYFDELEADLMYKLQKTFTEKELEIQNLLVEFHLRDSYVREMQENTNIVKNLASEFQSFMAIRDLVQLTNTAETELQQMFEGESFDRIEIFFDPLNLNMVKVNLPSIGKTEVRVDPSRIQLKVRKAREAQLIGQIRCSRNIESIQLIEKVKSKLPKGRNVLEILDCGFLLDGNLIFSDRKNNSLIVLDSNCVFFRNIKLNFSPTRFAIINEENIAITTQNQVNIVELKRGAVVKTLLPETKTRSIALTHDKDLMVEIIGAGYAIIDLQGNIKKTIQIDFSADYYHYPVCIKDRLYYMDTPKMVLYCYDFAGNYVSKFEDKLFKSHIAFTSDKSDILFCSSYSSSNVFVVSTDGKSSKEIIKSNMHIKEATAAHFNTKNNELLIVTMNGNIVLYDVI